MPLIQSKKHPNIAYEPDEHLIALPLETGLPFTLDIGRPMTDEEHYMEQVGKVLDCIEAYVEAFKGFVVFSSINPNYLANEITREFFDIYLNKCVKYGWHKLPAEVNSETDQSVNYLAIGPLLCPQYLRFFYTDEWFGPYFMLGLSFHPDEDGVVLEVTFDGEDMATIDIKIRKTSLELSQLDFKEDIENKEELIRLAAARATATNRAQKKKRPKKRR